MLTCGIIELNHSWYNIKNHFQLNNKFIDSMIEILCVLLTFYMS